MCQSCEVPTASHATPPERTGCRLSGSTLFAVLVLVLAGLILWSVSGSRAGSVRQEQTIDRWTIAIECPRQAQVNEAVSYTVLVKDEQGQPVNDAQVYLDVVMPSHPMGQVSPIAEPAGSGSYRAATIFTMAGEWMVQVVTNRAGTQRQATFPIDIQP